MKSLILIFIFIMASFDNLLWAQIWKQQNISFPMPSLGFEIRIVDDAVVWAWGRGGESTSEGWDQSYVDYSFGLSVDGGETWSTGGFPFNGKPGDLTSLAAINDSIAWVTYVDIDTYESKIFKTTNAGKNWNEQNAPFLQSWVDNIHFFDSDNGVIIADPIDNEFNIFITSDAGKTWQKVNAEKIPDSVNDFEYGIQGVFTTQGDKIWFNTYFSRIYYSNDKGKTWIVWTAPMDAFGLGLQMTSDESGDVYCVDVDIITGEYKLFRRNVSEMDWTNLTPEDNDKFIYFTAVPGTGNLIMHNTGDTKTRISYDKGLSWKVIDSLDINAKNFLFFHSSTTGYTFPRAGDGGIKSILKYNGSPLSGLLSQKPINVEISVFPNPAMDQIHVKSEYLNMDNYWLLINDAFGNLIYKKVLMRTTNISEIITTSNFPSGVYTLSLSNMDGVKSVPFIKM
jgi:hypothetical protein